MVRRRNHERDNKHHATASGGRATGVYYEYSKAANPIAAGYITPVPLADFPHRLHEEGPTRSSRSTSANN